MSKKSLYGILILKIFAVMFFFCSFSQAAWYEMESPVTGNITSCPNYFYQIPDSTYFLASTNISAVVIGNKRTLKILGTHNESDFFSPIAVFSDPYGGWNWFFVNEKGGYKLEINDKGEFGEKTKLFEDNFIYAKSYVVSNRKEIWYITDRIFRFSAEDEKLAEFFYPLTWDKTFSGLKIYPTDDGNILFIISKGATSGLYQGVQLNLITCEFKTLSFEDNKFFEGLYDIKQWNGHEGEFLVLKQESLNSFNIEKGTVELIVDGFKTSTRDIMQDEGGDHIYLFGYGGPFSLEIHPDFYTVDLVEKRVLQHTFPMEQYYGFSYFYLFYDIKDKAIITTVTYGDPRWGYNQFVKLDPANLTYKNISDKLYKYIKNLNYFADDNKLFIVCSYSPYIDMINIDSGEAISSISIGYNVDGWSVMKGSDRPDLLRNIFDTKFCHLSPISKRKIHDLGIFAGQTCKYPEGDIALIQGSTTNEPPETENIEYNLIDGSSKKIDLPYQFSDFYPDPKRNQIIGLETGVLFVEPGGLWTRWDPPSGYNFTYLRNIFDPENNTLWKVYIDSSTGYYHFYKISTETKEQLDSFIISDNTLNIRGEITADPQQRYLYFINEYTSDNKKRELVFLDLQKKEIAERFILQENIQFNDLTNESVVPGIIPIPEEDKLFVWDSYGSWCFDVLKKEKIYGSIVNNPKHYYFKDIKDRIHIEGIWDEERGLVVVVDHIWDQSKPIDEYQSIYEINPETGEVVNRVGFHRDMDTVFFPKNKDELYFMFEEQSRIYHYLLNPAWDKPATIIPSTNYVQLGEGDNARFSVNIKNPYDFEQRATAYIWMYAPDGTMLFFGPTGLTFDVTGIPITMPANCDVTGDILSFTMPAGVPEGFYNFNAVFINENGDRGPIGTWNFYVRD